MYPFLGQASWNRCTDMGPKLSYSEYVPLSERWKSLGAHVFKKSKDDKLLFFSVAPLHTASLEELRHE